MDLQLTSRLLLNLTNERLFDLIGADQPRQTHEGADDQQQQRQHKIESLLHNPSWRITSSRSKKARLVRESYSSWPMRLATAPCWLLYFALARLL